MGLIAFNAPASRPARYRSVWAVLARLIGTACLLMLAGVLPARAEDDEFNARIKPIFESRCIACHSCYNAPCQMNLQSYSGVTRGATSRNVYEARRLHSVPPTRLDIDASTTAEWRAMGFHDVLGSGKSTDSLLSRLTKLRGKYSALQPDKQVADSQVCAVDAHDSRIGETDNRAQLGMPYGLPPLSVEQIAALETWVAHGAPGPVLSRAAEREGIPATLRGEVEAWEAFLNDKGDRQQLVSRYIYEHLFLAHLHFASSAAEATRPPFFRLVRSHTACGEKIDEIATRRPTDAPGVGTMFYCLRPLTGTIVEKTHIPYELSQAKLERVKTLLLGGAWTVGRPRTYSGDEANNPFETFAAIPVKARYQFLLDDAQYHVATFIKGPVCNGTEAVNSIQEQFFVFFLKPDADNMVMLPEHAAAAESRLVLPGAWGSDVTVLQDIPFLKRLVDYREEYRSLRAQATRKLRPEGYRLEDIWDGDGSNPNALLTVFRHDDNAAVVKGAAGDLPKTVFVLDYPLLERLVYNLVVNFDVFGNVGHQVLTRVYMDLIRMEAEELFLSFLPPADRKRLRQDWYEGGLLTDVKLNLVFPLTNQDQPTGITFKNKSAHKLEFVQRALFERLPAEVRGPTDPINWRVIKVPADAKEVASATASEVALRRMASVYAKKATPFARFFPELSLVLLKSEDGSSRVYSIIHNREHENVSWIMGENRRLAPYQDTLTIRDGVFGAYPNMLFVVEAGEAAAFAKMAAGITKPGGYDRLVDRYGIRRSNARFWAVFDEINSRAFKAQPIERGALDLTRYQLDAQGR